MGIDIQLNQNTGVWTYKVTGDVEVVDFEGAMKTLEKVPDITDYTRTLWDLREITSPSPSSGEVRRSVDLAEGYRARRGHGKSAVVVGREVDFGLVRMYQAYAEQKDVEIAVFRDYSEALAWLEES
jgi:hypothetical protein